MSVIGLPGGLQFNKARSNSGGTDLRKNTDSTITEESSDEESDNETFYPIDVILPSFQTDACIGNVTTLADLYGNPALKKVATSLGKKLSNVAYAK